MSVIVTGYGLDSSNKTNLTADFVLQNPDKSIMFKDEAIFVHKKVMSEKAKEGFVMLDPALDLILEESDQRGEYLITVIVHDGVLGKAVIGEYRLTLKQN